MPKTIKIEEPTILNPSSLEDAQALLVSDSKFNTSYLKPIASTSKKLRQLVQDAGIQAMLRAFAMDNYDFVGKLYDTVAQNLSESNAKQFKEWLQKYSPVRYVKTDTGYTFRKNTKDTANPFDFVEAHNNPWYEIQMHSDDDIQKMFSFAQLDTAIENLIKKAEKALDGDNVAEGDEIKILARTKALRGVISPALIDDEIEAITLDEVQEIEQAT